MYSKRSTYRRVRIDQTVMIDVRVQQHAQIDRSPLRRQILHRQAHTEHWSQAVHLGSQLDGRLIDACGQC